MKAKKLTALLLCVFTALMLFSVMSFAEDATEASCTHSEIRWETVLQTCEKDGKYIAYCKSCNTHLEEKDEIIPAHNYNTVYVEKAATCTEAGSETVYCSWCKTLGKRIIPVDSSAHKFGPEEVKAEATCNKEGEKQAVCTLCKTVKKIVIPADATKHVAKEGCEWVIEIEPTCHVDGVEKNVCGVCNQEFKRYLSRHYDYADETKYEFISETPGNCTTPSVKIYRCFTNGCTVKVDGTVDPDAHDFTDETKWKYTDGASCSNPGKIEKHCRYNYNHIEEVTYAPHDFSGEVTVTEATVCGGNIITSVKCTGCSETETSVTVAGHIFGDWVLADGSNCTSGGTATRTCKCAEDVKENITFKAGTHLNYEVLADDPADCENIGWQIIRCEICSTVAEYFPEGNDPLGHDPGTWEVVEEETCEKAGKQQRVCRTCDKIVEESIIPQKAHSFILLEEGIDATCTEIGITPFRYCIYCTATFAQENILPLGHNFVEQNMPDENGVLICDRCYEYKVGDNDIFTCKCLCHNSNGLAKTVFKFVNFIYKLFGIMEECKCGAIHYDSSTSIFQDIFSK